MAWWDEWTPSVDYGVNDNPFLATRPVDSIMDLFPARTYGGQPNYTDDSEYLPNYASRTGINQGLDLYEITHPNPYANVDPNGVTQGGAWSADPTGVEWANINRLDPWIQEATRLSGVDANLIRALMMEESQGVWGSNDAGAVGYMQVIPGYHTDLGVNWYDERQNIIGGAQILRQNYNNCGSWQGAITAYYSGQCVARGASDNPAQGGSGETDFVYTQNVWNRYLGLNASGYGGGVQLPGIVSGVSAPGSYGTSTVGPPAGSAFWTITGGQVVEITQGHGMTDFAANSAYGQSAYQYTAAYTRNGSVLGHAGVDVGVPVGTPLYVPAAGTVVCAGSGVGTGEDSCSAYSSAQCSSEQCGRFQLKLANGDMLIFGHMSNVTVRPGQVLSAGSYVGNSGFENGPHVHVEYRRWVGEGVTSSGYEAVDPRAVFDGAIGTINLVEGTQVMTGGTQPYDFHSLIRAIQTGANPFVTEGYLPVGPSWLRNRITGGTSGYAGVGTMPGQDAYPLVGGS